MPDAYVENASRQFFYNWDWPAADRDWGLAMRARSAGMFLPLRTGRALQQWALGRTADALRIIREVRALDPLSPLFIVKEAHFLRQDGQLDQAAAAYETALREDPDMDAAASGLAEVRRAQGRFEEAIKLLRRAIPTGFDATLDHVLQTARGADGYRQIERRITEASLERLDEASAAGQYVAPIDSARLYAQLGDSTRALGFLDDALDVRDPGVVTLNADTVWDAVRAHPRFVAAVRRVGLPQG